MSTNLHGQPGRRARPTGSARTTPATAVAEPPELSERALATRQQIIGAARGVFEQMGFGGARMDDIAKAAGVSRPLLYHYFPNKRDLFVEVGRASTVAFREVTAVLRSTPAPCTAEDVRRIATAFLDYLDHHGSVIATWSHATWNDEQLRGVGLTAQMNGFAVIGAELARLRGGAAGRQAVDGMALLGAIERLWYYARVAEMSTSRRRLTDDVVRQLQRALRP